MQIVIHPEVTEEIRQAVRYYEQEASLGKRFREAVRNAVRRISENPNRFSFLSLNCRRCPLERFPHRVVYRAMGSVITIYAVMHPKRRPGYWIERLNS
jgi:hypothetical protein